MYFSPPPFITEYFPAVADTTPEKTHIIVVFRFRVLLEVSGHE